MEDILNMKLGGKCLDLFLYLEKLLYDQALKALKRLKVFSFTFPTVPASESAVDH